MMSEAVVCPACGRKRLRKALRVHTISSNNERETPQAFYDALDREFHFRLDAAASESSHKTPIWLGPGGREEDALAADSHWLPGSVFVNPPYSVNGHSVIEKWLAKAADECALGATIVMLIAARTDTKAWNIAMQHAAEIRLLSGRLTFEMGGKPITGEDGRPQPAPFPSAVIVFRPGMVFSRVVTQWDWKAAA